MKFETTPALNSDYRRLKAEHAADFKKVVRDKFVPACDAFAKDAATSWPSSLRVKPVRSAAGVLEMTWSFASPDGRATFEFVTVDGDLRVRSDKGRVAPTPSTMDSAAVPTAVASDQRAGTKPPAKLDGAASVPHGHRRDERLVHDQSGAATSALRSFFSDSRPKANGLPSRRTPGAKRTPDSAASL